MKLFVGLFFSPVEGEDFVSRFSPREEHAFWKWIWRAPAGRSV